MKKGIVLICVLASLSIFSSCTSPKNDTRTGGTMPIITIYNRDYTASDTIVSELPSGYEYIGDLPKEASNDTGFEGCKMYAIKELNSLTDFYLYQKSENTSDKKDASTEQSQWHYVQWVLCE
nr:hypothetical protein [uncultured Dysosmobacter sp.]